MRWRVERHPDDAVFLLGVKNVGAGLERRRLIGMRGDEDALSEGVVGPMVIGANDAVVKHMAKRELGAAVDAEVFPGVNAARIAPQDHVAAEQTDRRELAHLHIGRPADGEPLVAQECVFGHG
jgi:hypothetical protein